MKKKHVGLSLFLYLLCSCTILILMGALVGSVIGPVITYFRGGEFLYQWSELLYISSMGAGVGAVLGVGIWVLAKIEEVRKRNASWKEK
ncbi:hypothetical protein FCL49_17805 [Serratia proteamaculans]|uniref:hypothetical protein n=1 Tax=Serratia TaxID=613 RepID=UPI0015767D40|nr:MULTISPECIES: hypothetical protein [Serratia]NTX80588.1 hypothetical protein [Serratia proteamaculans]NTZ29940.1 hypothetical protein [Serratia proteamaculans]